jgi:hypothetical protein
MIRYNLLFYSSWRNPFKNGGAVSRGFRFLSSNPCLAAGLQQPAGEGNLPVRQGGRGDLNEEILEPVPGFGAGLCPPGARISATNQSMVLGALIIAGNGGPTVGPSLPGLRVSPFSTSVKWNSLPSGPSFDFLTFSVSIGPSFSMPKLWRRRWSRAFPTKPFLSTDFILRLDHNPWFQMTVFAKF